MNTLKITTFIIILALTNSANASLIVVNSSANNVTVTSLNSNLISASGYGSGPSISHDATESFYTVNFDVVGTQTITIDVTLDSNGTDYEDEAFLKIQKDTPVEYHLGAITQGIDSSIEGDDWVTDYTASGLLNISRDLFLTEGSYTLQASARGISFDASSSYSFELTAVPLPSAVWLFGSGLIGLFGLARRKKT